MIGLTTSRAGRSYRIPEFVIFSLILDQNRFLLESGGHIFSSQKIKQGLEYEFLISEFEEPSTVISEEENALEIDYEFEKERFSEEAQWEYKLQTFKRLESILMKEDLI